MLLAGLRGFTLPTLLKDELEPLLEKFLSGAVPIDSGIEGGQRDPCVIDTCRLIEKLGAIDEGREAANEYHNFIVEALKTIFFPALQKPNKEQNIHEGRKRVDIVFNNKANKGFFFDLIQRHKVRCPYVFFECKNYSSDPKNPELDQLTGRFSRRRGNFGALVCRKVKDKEVMLQRCKDSIHDNRGYVLVLDDFDIKRLLQLRANDPDGIDNYMDDLFRQLMM